MHEIQAVSATASTPITITIEDSAGTTVYGSKDYVVSNATDDSAWRQYYVTALCPANTAVYAKLKIGNSTGNGTVGVQLRLSDYDNNHGMSIYPGHFVYPYGAQGTVNTNDGVEYQNRVYWSEALDFTDWRNENFFEVDESPGSVTALGAVNDRLIVYKANGIWVYRPTNSALAPFVRESFIPKMGCIESDALVFPPGREQPAEVLRQRRRRAAQPPREAKPRIPGPCRRLRGCVRRSSQSSTRDAGRHARGLREHAG